jgi:hypothetical protein
MEKGSRQVLQHDATLQQVITGSGDKKQIMGILFDIFRTAIEKTDADKEYSLRRLSENQEISAAMMDYMKGLLGKAVDFSVGPYKCRSKDEPDSWLPVRSTIKPISTKEPARKKIP